MTLKHRDTSSPCFCVTPPGHRSTGSCGAPCTGAVTLRFPIVLLMHSTEPRQLAVEIQGPGNPIGPQGANTPQTGAGASINVVALAASTHERSWIDPTDGAEHLMPGLLRTAGKGPASIPAPSPAAAARHTPQSRRDIASTSGPWHRPAPSGASQAPPTLPGSPAARGKWRPAASGSADPPERVPCPGCACGGSRPAAGAREAAAAVAPVPQTEALLSPQVPWRTRRTGRWQAGPAAGPWWELPGLRGRAGPGWARCRSRGRVVALQWQRGAARPGVGGGKRLWLSDWERALRGNGSIESNSVR